MNYLAHLYLSGEEEHHRVGGFLADFVKGPLAGKYPHEIEQGMRLHRRIDFWSDQHRAIASIRALLPKAFSRYAGIIADVLGDHFLSLDWTSYNKFPLEQFAKQEIQILKNHESIFPEKAKYCLNRMEQGSWLTNYHRLPYCVGTLEKIGQRLKRDNPLHLTYEPIKSNYQELQSLCTNLFIDLKANVAKWHFENGSIANTDQN